MLIHIVIIKPYSISINGTIEIVQRLKWIKEKGITFKSETDTEVIANLVGYYLDEIKVEPNKYYKKKDNNNDNDNVATVFELALNRLMDQD